MSLFGKRIGNVGLGAVVPPSVETARINVVVYILVVNLASLGIVKIYIPEISPADWLVQKSFGIHLVVHFGIHCHAGPD